MWAMIAFAVKGAPSDQTDSVNPRAPDLGLVYIYTRPRPDIQEITVREMI